MTQILSQNNMLKHILNEPDAD
jgi:hypothetical protein